MSDRGGWDDRLAELRRRLDAVRAMGGSERLERQRRGGSLDARQRVDELLDPGTFTELGTLVGYGRGPQPGAPADALVAGFGAVEDRPVLVGAEDFTVQGGSIGLGNHAKRRRLTDLALQERVPLVLLLDGAGERVSNAGERSPRSPNDLQGLVALSGHVPTVAAVMGPSAGHGALAAPLADLVVMVEGAALFSAGPPLVRAATGEDVDRETLGGVAVHADVSGVAHNRVADDRSALDLVRRYLSFLPSSAWERPPRRHDGDVGEREVPELLDVIPVDGRRGYDVREALAVLADGGDVLEIQPEHGASVVTALVRLGGRPVAVVANQPRVRAGSIDGPAADKAARFLEVVGSFHLPALFLTDNPGVLAGTAAEREGVLRRAARMYAAQARHPGPKLHVTLRKAYGFGSSLMAMNPFDGQTVALALPTAELGAMPVRSRGDGGEGGGRDGVEAIGHEGSGAGDPGPYRSADTMSYDEIVEPARLRDVLLAALRLADARQRGPARPVLRPGALP